MRYKGTVCVVSLAIAFAAVSAAYADPFPSRSYSGSRSGGVTSGGKFRGGSSTYPNFSHGPSFKTVNVGSGGGGGSTRVVQQYETVFIPVASPYPPAGNYYKSSNRPVMQVRR